MPRPVTVGGSNEKYPADDNSDCGCLYWDVWHLSITGTSRLRDGVAYSVLSRVLNWEIPLRLDFAGMTDVDLERWVMACRYAYYCLSRPILSDSDYDRLERTAMDRLPIFSPVHNIGSSLPDSYTADDQQFARHLLAKGST